MTGDAKRTNRRLAELRRPPRSRSLVGSEAVIPYTCLLRYLVKNSKVMARRSRRGMTSRLVGLVGMVSMVMQTACTWYDDQLRFTQTSTDGKIAGYLLCSPASLTDPFICHRRAAAACAALGQELRDFRGVKSGGPTQLYDQELEMNLSYRITHIVECAPNVG